MIIYAAFWYAAGIAGALVEPSRDIVFGLIVMTPIFGRVFGWW